MTISCYKNQVNIETIISVRHSGILISNYALWCEQEYLPSISPMTFQLNFRSWTEIDELFQVIVDRHVKNKALDYVIPREIVSIQKHFFVSIGKMKQIDVWRVSCSLSWVASLVRFNLFVVYAYIHDSYFTTGKLVYNENTKMT